MLTRLLFLAMAPALLLAHPRNAASQAPRPVTLDEAIRMAHQNAPAAVQASGALRLARVQAQGASLGFVPNVSVSASSSWQRGQRIGQSGSLIDFTGPSKSYNDGLSLSMELFDGGRRFHEIAASRAALDAADASELTALFSIALQVKEEYFNILAARESEGAALAQVAEAEQQLQTAVTRVQAGAALRSDSLRAAVQLGNAHLALISARNSLDNANSALTRLVGSTIPVTAGDVPADVPGTALTEAALVPMLQDSPALTQARAQLRSTSASVRTARSAYLPTVSATYGRNGSGFDSRFGYRQPFAYSSSFRLALSLPVFNGLQREENLVRAYTAADLAEANLRDSELRIRQELTVLLSALRSATQRLEVQEMAVRASEEDLSIQQQRYEFGAALQLDVLQSQSQLNNARAGLIAARLDLRVTRARLELLLGRDLGTM